MDEQAFREIIERISKDAIDEMVEDSIGLNSTNYLEMMQEKFERFAALLS
jgi:hypothetical protein